MSKMNVKTTQVQAMRWQDSDFLLQCIKEAGLLEARKRENSFASTYSVMPFITANFPNSLWFIIWGITPRIGRERIGFVQFSQTTQKRVWEIVVYNKETCGGFGFDLWENIVDLARYQLNAHRIEFSIAAYNKNTLNAVRRRTNAEEEGIQRSCIWAKDKWYDSHLFGLVL